jgi:hypothetical protein
MPVLTIYLPVFIPNGKRDQQQFKVATSGLPFLMHRWEAGAGNGSCSCIVTEIGVVSKDCVSGGEKCHG